MGTEASGEKPAPWISLLGLGTRLLETGEDGKVRLAVTLPDAQALDGLAAALARLVAAGLRRDAGYLPAPGLAREYLPSRLPQPQRAMRGDPHEVFIGRQQRQRVTHAQLSEQSVDRADLHTSPATPVAQFGSVDMILPVRIEKGQCGEPLDEVFARTRAGETLQQLLKDQSRRDQNFAVLEGPAQCRDFRGGRHHIPAKGQRPDAGIDEQDHRRERSAL
jgi:hypothetical protein